MATPQNYFGRPEFWLDYCESEEDAELVARMFPVYWREWFASSLTSRIELAKRADQEAFAWAAVNHRRAVNSLKGDFYENPLRNLKFDADRFDGYGKEVVSLAELYVAAEKPRPTPVRPRTSDGYVVVSGGRLASQALVAETLHRRQGLRWGPLLLESSEALQSNFCVVGMPRSGKTTLLRLLLQSTNWFRRKLVVYDEKTGAPAAIFQSEKEMERQCVLLNPFDARGVAWDIARDADGFHSANEIARTLIPQVRNENPFFVAAPRAILAAAMTSLTALRGHAWGLMDLLLAVNSQNLKTLLSSSPQGQEAYATFFADNNPSGIDIKKTVSAVLNPLLPVAAAWEHCRRRVSLREWARSGSDVVILGNHNAYAAAMQTINRTVVAVLIESLLDRTSDEANTRAMFFLDEFQSLGYLDNLTTLLRTGPGLGVTSALGVHDLGLLKETYGSHAEGVLAMCGHYAVLRTNSHDTARWASELFGQQTIRVRKQSVSKPVDGTDPARRETLNTSEVDETRPVVHADRFFELPLAGKSSGLTGYFKSSMHPPYKGHLDKSTYEVTGERQKNSPEEHRLFQSEVAEFVPRDKAELTPRDEWEEVPKANQDIGDSKTEVLLTDADGRQFGYPMRLTRALEKAKAAGLDVVEFPPGLDPPNCVMMHASWIDEATRLEMEEEAKQPVPPQEPDETEKDIDPSDYNILLLKRIKLD